MKSEAPCAGDVGLDFAFTSPGKGGTAKKGMNPVFHRWQSPRRWQWLDEVAQGMPTQTCSGWVWECDSAGAVHC